MGIHMRVDGCPIVTVAAVGPRYSMSEIAAALPKAAPKPRGVVASIAQVPPERAPLVDDAAAYATQVQPKLWAGDWQTLKTIGKKQVYPSQSEADLALASYIARYLEEVGAPADMLPSLTEAVFDRSALAQRDKWLYRPDYRANTVGRACASLVSSSTGPAPRSTSGARVDWSLHGDVRNARFFADRWQGLLAYIHERKRWMRWEPSRWVMCTAGEEVERAKETCQAIYKAAGDELARNPEKAQKLVKEAAQAHLSPRIRAMVDLAQSDPALSLSSSHLDADNYVIGVGNGIVDLRKALLLPNEPGRYIMRYCDADYEAEALCPRWMQFLAEVFQGDQATITAVQRLLGYSLTGLSVEEFLIFCVGFGANGKSIFGNVVAAILGDYAKSAPSTLLAARRTDDHSPRSDVAMLDGARMVSINELPAGMHLDEQVVKQIAGREPISARHLYGEFFTFQPRFTAWVRTNHKPIVKGDDDGIWRRIVVLPFRRKFEEHEQDPHLEAELLAERDGILRWMVEGARLYLQKGIYLSPAMQAERKQYRKDSDLFGEFLEERTTAVAGAKVEQSELYMSWALWNQQNGTQPGSKRTFTERLAERGFPATKSNGRRFYIGLAKATGSIC